MLGNTGFGVSDPKVGDVCWIRLALWLSGILSSIVVIGWCCEVRGDTSGPTTVGQWTRCSVCVNHV